MTPRRKEVNWHLEDVSRGLTQRSELDRDEEAFLKHGTDISRWIY